MLDGTYYLNNSGSRWVIYEKGTKAKGTWYTKTGKKIIRTIIECYSFGNFGAAIISYKGKKERVLFDTVLED